jgi:hypothetical protein
MAHVLIGFAEALPAPEVVFSLLAAGHQVSAFAQSASVPLRHLPLTALHVIPASSAWPDDVIGWLQGLMARPDAPDIVLPLDDRGLWLVDAALGGSGKVAGATGDQAAVALDKRRQFDAARAAGLNVPETWVVPVPDRLGDGLPLPAILKPAMAVRVGARGIEKGMTRYLLSAIDRDAAVAALAGSDQPSLVQPLVAGTGEGIFGFACGGGVAAWSGHRRVRMMNPHGSGASACIAVTPDRDTCARIAVFLDRIGWTGPFMMEFLRDSSGTLWFMEMNGRMWGSMALARRQGFEYPAWAVQAALTPGFCPAVPDPVLMDRPVRNLGREILHLLFVLRGPKTPFHRQTWPRFGHSLAGVLRPAPLRQFYNYDPASPGYLLRDAWATVRGALK